MPKHECIDSFSSRWMQKRGIRFSIKPLVQWNLQQVYDFEDQKSPPHIWSRPMMYMLWSYDIWCESGRAMYDSKTFLYTNTITTWQNWPMVKLLFMHDMPLSYEYATAELYSKLSQSLLHWVTIHIHMMYHYLWKIFSSFLFSCYIVTAPQVERNQWLAE